VFTPGEAAPFPAPYWVLKLGPVVDDLYDYSIVSDNLNLSLFVLARDPTTFNEKYDAEVQSYLQDAGFTGKFNTPVSSYQGDDCHYADAPVYVSPEAAFTGSKPVTVDVDLENYVGHWYQMYADAYVAATFERGSFCATADYRLNSDATVSLFNSQANGAADGPLSNVTGTAYTTDVPGELSVINLSHTQISTPHPPPLPIVI
jgi:lipocalin